MPKYRLSSISNIGNDIFRVKIILGGRNYGKITEINFSTH